MNTPKEYLLIFRGTDWYRGLSAEQMQQVGDQWMAWFNGLKEEGKALAGNPLEREGKIVSGKNGRVVSDGPFAEAKETIGGYFLLKVNTLDEAVAIAQRCPGLAYGIRVEVRTVAEECPMAAEARVGTQLAHGASRDRHPSAPLGARRTSEAACLRAEPSIPARGPGRRIP